LGDICGDGDGDLGMKGNPDLVQPERLDRMSSTT